MALLKGSILPLQSCILVLFSPCTPRLPRRPPQGPSNDYDQEDPMIFRPTGKLAQKLHVLPAEVLPLHKCPYADWSACVLTANRRQYVLLTNTASLFSTVIPGAGIANSSTFHARAMEAIGDQLKQAGHDEIWLQTQKEHGAETHFSKTLNASLTGSVNMLVRYCQSYAEKGHVPPSEMGRRLNTIPMRALDSESPEQAFAALAEAPPKQSLVVGKSAQGGAKRLNHRQSYVHRQSFDRVLQFKIQLKDIEPAVWRRIQVPVTYSFWDLHCAITDSLGWLDYHLHEFRVESPKGKPPLRIGIPMDDDYDQEPLRPGQKLPVRIVFFRVGDACTYTYDFGDDWVHDVTLEAVLPRQEKLAYPCCIDGERACPPEDVGGPAGYAHFLKAMETASHPEHEMLQDWVGGSFDPDWFDSKVLRFASPQLRWRVAFDHEAPPKSLRMVQYHRLQRGSQSPR